MNPQKTVSDIKRMLDEVRRLEEAEDRKDTTHGTVRARPPLTVSTPVAVLGPNDWKKSQLSRALRRIAPGCRPEDVLFLVDNTHGGTVLGFLNVNSCSQGIVVTRDCLWDTQMKKGLGPGRGGKVPMPLRLSELKSVHAVPDEDSYLRITLSDGTHYEAYVSIYGEFTYRLLHYLMDARLWETR